MKKFIIFFFALGSWQLKAQQPQPFPSSYQPSGGFVMREDERYSERVQSSRVPQNYARPTAPRYEQRTTIMETEDKWISADGMWVCWVDRNGITRIRAIGQEEIQEERHDTYRADIAPTQPRSTPRPVDNKNPVYPSEGKQVIDPRANGS